MWVWTSGRVIKASGQGFSGTVGQEKVDRTRVSWQALSGCGKRGMSGDKRDGRESSGRSKKKAGRIGMGGPSTDVGRYQNEGQEGEVCSVRQGWG